MTLLALQDYFHALAVAHYDIHHFVTGDSEHILSHDRSTISYPALWLETPEISWKFQPGPAERIYSLTFVVLTNSAMDVPEREQYALSRTLEITHHLLAKLNDDIADGALPLRWYAPKASSMPILGYGVDNDLGWRTTLELLAPALNCSCLFSSSCPPAWRMSFQYTNTAPDFTVTITPIAPSDGAWVYAWEWSLDGGAITTGMPSGSVGTGSVLYIAVLATLGGCTLMASAIIRAGDRCGASVPGLYSPSLVQ